MANVPPADRQPTPSARLIQVLRTYCAELNPATIDDLRHSLHAGRYPWLRDELATAIISEPAGRWWHTAVTTPEALNIPQSRQRLRAEQRNLWHALFDDAPFPTKRTTSVPAR